MAPYRAEPGRAAQDKAVNRIKTEGILAFQEKGRWFNEPRPG
jgi:hypothetical protein